MAASYWWALLMIWILHTTDTLGTGKPHKHFSTTSTWEDAKAGCPDGYTLPLYQTAAERSEVNRALVEEKINDIWLAYQRRNLVVWTWNDNSPADQAIVKSTWEKGRHCGVFHLRDRVIEADNCSKAGFGYVCSGNISCTSDELINRACITLDGKAYLYECDVQNWYEARSRCRRYGMDLAIVKQEHYQKLGIEWYNKKGRKCLDVWIGLFKEKWDAGINGEATFFLWGSGQPALTGDCGLLTTNGQGRGYWRAENCSTKHHRLCFPKERLLPEITSTETVWTTISSTEKSIKSTPVVRIMKDCYDIHFWRATLALSLICIVLLVCIIWLLWRCHGIQKTSTEGTHNIKDSAQGLFSICLPPCHRNLTTTEQAQPNSEQITANSVFNPVQQGQGELEPFLPTNQPQDDPHGDAIDSGSHPTFPGANVYGETTVPGQTNNDTVGKRSISCTDDVASRKRTNVCRPVSMYIVGNETGFEITFFVTNCENAHEILFPMLGHGTIIPTDISIPRKYTTKTTLQASVKCYHGWDLYGKEWVNLDLSEIENVLEERKFETLIRIHAKRAADSANSDVSERTTPELVLTPTFTILEAGTDLARGNITVNIAKVKQSAEQDRLACRDDECGGGSGMTDVLHPEFTVKIRKQDGTMTREAGKELTSSANREDELKASNGGSSATGTEEEENQE